MGEWVGGWPIVDINLSLYRGCDGHAVRYGFVGRVNRQSIHMTVNLFLHIHYMYYTHQSFSQYTILN